MRWQAGLRLLVLFAQEGNISLTVLPKKWLPPFWRKKQEQFIARIIEPDDWLYETNFFRLAGYFGNKSCRIENRALLLASFISLVVGGYLFISAQKKDAVFYFFLYVAISVIFLLHAIRLYRTRGAALKLVRKG
jgi:hypothetical protein